MTQPDKKKPLALSAVYPKETRGTNFFESDINLQRLLARLDPAMLQRNDARLKDFGAFAGGPVDAGPGRSTIQALTTLPSSTGCDGRRDRGQRQQQVL